MYPINRNDQPSYFVEGYLESAGRDTGNRYGLSSQYFNIRLPNGRLITLGVRRYTVIEIGARVNI